MQSFYIIRTLYQECAAFSLLTDSMRTLLGAADIFNDVRTVVIIKRVALENADHYLAPLV